VSVLFVRLLDVYRKPLDDTVDLVVSSHQTGRVVGQVTDAKASALIRIPGLTPLETYVVRVFPSRHRPVGQFVRGRPGARTDAELVCPVDPKRVLGIAPPAYASLPDTARAILEATSLEHPPLNASGRALYESSELSDVSKAGLLNILAKMGQTPLPDGRKVLDHVDSLYRIRGDRLFANVGKALRDLVKTGVGAQLFRVVDGSLHRPDPGFVLVDSYKTPDPYGNLQITFFASVSAPLRFTADIDIDDAGGVAHLFQVLDHTISKTDTNPFDIHEILIYHQFLDPGYRLVLA
jgi:hypothetical protein